jgi:hypothetical protein
MLLEDWTSPLQKLFLYEISNELGIEWERVGLEGLRRSSSRRLLALQATILIDCHSEQDARQIRIIAEVAGLMGAATRAGVRGTVRMLGLDVVNLAVLKTPSPSPIDGLDPAVNSTTPAPGEVETTPVPAIAPEVSSGQEQSPVESQIGMVSLSGPHVMLPLLVRSCLDSVHHPQLLVRPGVRDNDTRIPPCSKSPSVLQVEPLSFWLRASPLRGNSGRGSRSCPRRKRLSTLRTSSSCPRVPWITWWMLKCGRT